MTAVRPEDVEPEDARASAPVDWRSDPSFIWPERVPWSQLNFTEMWGFALPRNKREHFEVVGPSGSGKTHLVEKILQDHYTLADARRKQGGRKHLETGAIFIATKADDDIFSELGWPVMHDTTEIRPGDTNLIFWPRTKRTGQERAAFHDQKVGGLLDRLFAPKANTVVAFDEIGYVESLSGNTRVTVQQFWREGRALGIQVIGMKQRPQGALRDMHSETFWTAAFKPNDRSDLERFAELFGHRRDWMPVFDSLDPDRHEFIIRHSRSNDAYISWVDTPLVPQKIKRKGYRGLLDARGA